MKRDWPMWRLFRLGGGESGFSISSFLILWVFEIFHDKKLKDRKKKKKKISTSDPLFPHLTVLLHN